MLKDVSQTQSDDACRTDWFDGLVKDIGSPKVKMIFDQDLQVLKPLSK